MTGSADGPGIGEGAPGFELPDTDGTTRSLADAEGAPATVVFWTCNHCPYAIAWHDRLVEAARDYAPQGVRFFAVNSNDAARYPADSYEAMRDRVETEEWPFPYLHDESQRAAHAWGAQVTPHVYVLDREHRLRYQGAPDPDYQEPAHNASWLREAIDSVLAGEELARAQTDPVGCSVKWKP
jgi:peroxiredoxin